MAWISRVPSELNPADSLSHGLWDVADALQATQVSADMNGFFKFVEKVVHDGVPSETSLEHVLKLAPDLGMQ